MLLPRKEACGDLVCHRGRRMGGDAGFRREKGRAGVWVGAATQAAAGKKAERDLGRGGGAVPPAVGKKVQEIVGILGRSERR
jgi:hypothetical protein